MKIQIQPEYLPDREPKFWYKSVIHGEIKWSCGYSWEQAKERHIAMLRDVTQAPAVTLPPTEEVEL